MPTSPYAVLEVERAASDLRRGEAVLLLTAENTPLKVRSGEHYPKEQAISDPQHPAIKLMKITGLLPRAVVEHFYDDAEGMLTVSTDAIDSYPHVLAASLIKVSEAHVPLADAEDAKIIAFRPRFGHEEHLAVVIGEPKKNASPHVRIHSSCVTGDVFGSLRCDCGNQLHKAIRIIREAGGGAVIYVSQEGRGIGIANKLRAYGLQDSGLDTVEANEALGFAADERDFAIAVNIIKQLDLNNITLLTNNPEKVEAVRRYGIDVAMRLPIVTESNPHNEHYIDTKRLKMGHQF